ncbi:MAG: hypothetical protein Q9197_002774 [Variospora fuerteventurae]
MPKASICMKSVAASKMMLHAPSIADWLDARLAIDSIPGAHKRAQGKCILLAYGGEVPKAHDWKILATAPAQT